MNSCLKQIRLGNRQVNTRGKLSGAQCHLCFFSYFSTGAVDCRRKPDSPQGRLAMQRQRKQHVASRRGYLSRASTSGRCPWGGHTARRRFICEAGLAVCKILGIHAKPGSPPTRAELWSPQGGRAARRLRQPKRAPRASLGKWRIVWSFTRSAWPPISPS